MGVMPSVALLRHFFYLRLKEGHCSGCANFVVANGTNAISKARKKAEGFRSKWVLMDAKCSHPRLVLPTEMPVSQEGWLRAKLTDPRAAQVLERMTADLRPGDSRAAKLTGAMIVKEFMTQRVAHLQARPRPLWKLGDEGDDLRLRPEPLSDEELRSALCSLVGDDQGYPPDGLVPLYRRPDGAKVVAALPIFDEHGLMPPAPMNITATTTLLVVSSGESREEGEEEEEEEEEHDSEATHEGAGETSPLRKADILRTLPDDDDEADVPPEREEPPVAGGSSRPKASPQRRPPAEVPTRGRSALISRDDAPAPTPPGAASGPSAAPSSAPGARAPAPQAARLSGFKLKKRRDYTAVDQ